MHYFVDSSFRGVDHTNLNYIQEYLHAVTLIHTINVDGERILHQSYLGIKGNGLHKAIDS